MFGRPAAWLLRLCPCGLAKATGHGNLGQIRTTKSLFVQTYDAHRLQPPPDQHQGSDARADAAAPPAARPAARGAEEASGSGIRQGRQTRQGSFAQEEAVDA